MKVDDLIALIRKVRGLVEKTDSYAEQGEMLATLDSWRSYLMKSDLEGFYKAVRAVSAKNPDMHDELLQLMFDEAGVKTVDDLGLYNIQESYKRSFREFIAL